MFSNQNIIIQEHAAFPKIFDYERNIATLTHPKILNAHFDPNPLYFTNKIVRTINYLQMFEKKQRFQKTRVDQFEIFWKKLSKIFKFFLTKYSLKITLVTDFHPILKSTVLTLLYTFKI